MKKGKVVLKVIGGLFVLLGIYLLIIAQELYGGIALILGILLLPSVKKKGKSKHSYGKSYHDDDDVNEDHDNDDLDYNSDSDNSGDNDD